MIDLLWPSNWMVVPIILGGGSYIGTTILKDAGILKHLQPMALHTIAGIIIGFFSILATSNLPTVVAATVWATLLPPLVHYTGALLTTVLESGWNALGGRDE